MADNNWFNRLVESLGSFEKALEHCFVTSYVDIIAANNFKAMARLTNYLKTNNQPTALRRVNQTLKTYGLTDKKVADEKVYEETLTDFQQIAETVEFDPTKFAGKPDYVLKALAVRYLSEKREHTLLLPLEKKSPQKRSIEERVLAQAQALLKSLQKYDGPSSQLQTTLVRLIDDLQSENNSDLNEVYNVEL